MQTITINEITDMGREETLAAIEELGSLGYLTSTHHDEPVHVATSWGDTIPADEAVAKLRDYLAA